MHRILFNLCFLWRPFLKFKTVDITKAGIKRYDKRKSVHKCTILHFVVAKLIRSQIDAWTVKFRASCCKMMTLRSILLKNASYRNNYNIIHNPHGLKMS